MALFGRSKQTAQQRMPPKRCSKFSLLLPSTAVELLSLIFLLPEGESFSSLIAASLDSLDDDDGSISDIVDCSSN